jgi:hypothetical protein
MKAEMQGDALKNGFHKADERRKLRKPKKNCFHKGDESRNARR